MEQPPTPTPNEDSPSPDPAAPHPNRDPSNPDQNATTPDQNPATPNPKTPIPNQGAPAARHLPPTKNQRPPGANQHMPPGPNQHPPYWLGLLCLIPLVGALVGTALLLYGIIKYKDKWLIIIGAFGIVFTTAIYTAMFAFMRSPFARKGFEPIVRSDLNSLVADIELYRLQHGRYPDSLPQLRVIDKLVRIQDPIQTLRIKEGHLDLDYYQYQNLGDKYYLFSNGVDGLPNTADDIFPQVDINDSSKIGFIRPH